MKKSKYLKIVMLVFVVMFCCACNGNVTRDIRHAGFNVSTKFICDAFYPKDKEDTSYKKIRYLLGNNLISEEGDIYEVSLGTPYANKQNCKKAETTLQVKSILDNKIIKATDNKYYYLEGQTNVAPYSEIPNTDNSYAIYDLLLKDEDVVKVYTADSSSGLFYILKVDGNIYANVISSQDRNSPPMVISTQPIYNYTDYGDGTARIIDFSYAGNSLNTFIKTEDSIYRMRVTNSEQCSKYTDIPCEYSLQHDPMFEQYKDRIIAYNGGLLITDYKQVFAVAK